MVPQTAGFGRWAKVESTASSSQGMDAQNAGSGVHARPGRLLTPRARGGTFGSPLNRRLRSIRSRCRGLKCSAKMGVLTVISGLLGGRAQRAGHVKLGPHPACPVMMRKNWTLQLLHITPHPLCDPRAFPALETPFGSPASQRAMASTAQAGDSVQAYWPTLLCRESL